MRLALISAEYPCGSGESFLEPELRVLARECGTVRVIPTVPSRGRRSMPPGAAACVLPLFAPATFGLAVLEALRSPRRALRAVRALLQLMSADGSLSIRLKDLAVFAKALRVARVVRRERISHVHAYWFATPATIAFLVGELTATPYSVTAHRWDVYAPLGQARKARGATFVRVISERGATDLARRLAPDDAARIAVVRLGVALAPSVPVRAPSPALRVLVAANIIPLKDHATILRALALLRARGVDFTCTFAGDGPLREQCARAARALRIDDAVVFAGQLPHTALLARYAAGDVDACVLASREDPGGEMEGIPVSLMEAMAAGVPCVATRTGSIPELIDSSCGVLFEQGDAEGLAGALQSLAAQPDLAARLGAAARARVAERYDVERNARALAAMLRRGTS